MEEHLVLGPLDALAKDTQITDITVTCEGQVWVDRGNGMEFEPMRSSINSAHGVREYAVQLCAQLGKRLDDVHPIADAATQSGVRIHAVIAPLVPYGASLSIRFPDRTRSTLDSLVTLGAFPATWMPILQAIVDRHATVLIAGGTGTGKTTMLKALLGQVDACERIVSVEEVRELGSLHHDNTVSLASREANVEGKGAVGLPQLVKATLRMRPDRVVLGECRGEEIADLLRALNSGHRGGMTTVHADSIERLPARLITLGLLAELTPQAIAMLAAGAFDVVIHMRRTAHGVRHIAQIGQLITSAQGELTGQMACAWDGVREPKYGPGWPSLAQLLQLSTEAMPFLPTCDTAEHIAGTVRYRTAYTTSNTSRAATSSYTAMA